MGTGFSRENGPPARPVAGGPSDPQIGPEMSREMSRTRRDIFLPQARGGAGTIRPSGQLLLTGPGAGPSRGRGPVLFLRTLLAALAAALVASPALAKTLGVSFGGDGHRRELGRGQIRFDGAGPERWAQRFRQERRLAARLRGQLSGGLARIVFLVDAFNCIHRFEGAWGAATGNGYYGGLQMDVPFQERYAPELLRRKGTADNWTPSEQIAAAIAAYGERGFGPWPKTARACGLR